MKTAASPLSPRAPIERRAYSIAEFGAAYGVSRTTVHRAIVSGQLRRHKIGRRVLITAEDAQVWLAGQREGSQHRVDVYTLGGIIRHARDVLGADRVAKIVAEARAEVER